MTGMDNPIDMDNLIDIESATCIESPPWKVMAVFDPDGNGIHGLNERIRVDVLYKGRDYLTDLVKAYAAR